LNLCIIVRRFIWNFFRLEAEHLNNVGEFRAVRDISLRPIKRQPKEEKDEEGDDVSPLQTNLHRGASLQVVKVASSQNIHTASIRSSDISSIQSPDLQYSATGSGPLVVQNEYSTTPSSAAEANKLELMTPNQQIVRAEVMDTIAEDNM